MIDQQITREELLTKLKKINHDYSQLKELYDNDIEKLKLMEESLRIATVYSNSLIEATLDPFVSINTDGIITNVNKAAENITNLSRKELIGTFFSDYFTEPEKISKIFQNVLENGFVTNYPLTICQSGIKFTDVLFNACVFKNEQGSVIEVMVVVRDINECKIAEIALSKQTKELERLNRYFIDREIRMVELKKEVNELLQKYGQEKRYPVS
ncbi:MAG: PAS domain-containing protein [Bacteroidia bacterium]|nr:PAS domain-containing protein [Bacteroidia bacterium]